MGDSAYNVLGLPDLELVSQHYETRKHQDGYSYDIIVYAVKHVGYVPYCYACQEATGETCMVLTHLCCPGFCAISVNFGSFFVVVSFSRTAQLLICTFLR